MTDNAPTPFVIAAVALFALGLLIRHIIRTNRRRTPANTNTARWSLGDWPACEAAHCRFPGTNHIVWVKSGVEGDLCPGCRDTNVARGLARDAWDASA